MLRRLAHHQPDSFAFTPANQAWAEAQISKYPEGRQASAIIALLWRAQEQEGWLSRPAIEHVADMLGMAYIRALEVATFYFMFQLHPVGNGCPCPGLRHLELHDLGLGRPDRRLQDSASPPRRMCPRPTASSSWEEVECLGACANAPMVQIGKDYYEDLTPGALGRDPRRTGRRQGAAAGAAERPLRLRAEAGADHADRAWHRSHAAQRQRRTGAGGRRHGETHRRHRSAADRALARRPAGQEAAAGPRPRRRPRCRSRCRRSTSRGRPPARRWTATGATEQQAVATTPGGRRGSRPRRRWCGRRG